MCTRKHCLRSTTIANAANNDQQTNNDVNVDVISAKTTTDETINVAGFGMARRPTTQSPNQAQCTPGTRWKEHCNNCWCTETGFAACTLRGCLSNFPNFATINHESRRLRRQAIEPIYTENDLKDPNFRCTPSYSFKLECNTCWCSADGRTPRYCTRIACKPKVYSTNAPPPLLNEPVTRMTTKAN
jgi:hypothetical protein